MRRALIALGTLGGGTVIAFVLAGLAFLADPDGRLVPANTWPVPIAKGAPLPQPAILVDPIAPQVIPGAAGRASAAERADTAEPAGADGVENHEERAREAGS